MSEIVKQFLKVQNFNNWTDDKKMKLMKMAKLYLYLVQHVQIMWLT